MDALTRIKVTLLDTATPPVLETATGGVATYANLYADNGNDEAKTLRAAASILYGYYATQPTSISSGGESLSWASDRAAFYQAISLGQGGGAAAGVATGQTLRSKARRDYTLGGGDVVPEEGA